MKAVHALDEAVDSLMCPRPNQHTYDRQHGSYRTHVFNGEISGTDQPEHTAIPSGGMKIVEEENVPETAAVAKTMESLITLDGASLIFGTSFGYFDPFMIDMAREFPKVQFRHPTSLWNKDKHPANLGGYFCYIEQAHYVNGVAAGLSTKSNKLGYRRQADRAGAADDQCVRARRA